MRKVEHIFTFQGHFHFWLVCLCLLPSYLYSIGIFVPHLYCKHCSYIKNISPLSMTSYFISTFYLTDFIHGPFWHPVVFFNYFYVVELIFFYCMWIKLKLESLFVSSLRYKINLPTFPFSTYRVSYFTFKSDTFIIYSCVWCHVWIQVYFHK